MMRTRSTPWLLAAAAALAVAALGCKDARYCDENTRCNDPAYPFCDTVLHECESTQADAGVDAHQPDAQDDAPVVPDGGCEQPQHECSGFCYDLTDPAHCGESCLECTAPANGTPSCDDGANCSFACDATYFLNVDACDSCSVPDHCGPNCDDCTGTDTPLCSGHTGKCICDGNSCTGTTPICDATTQACRKCREHSECASGACDRVGGGCVAVADVLYLDKGNLDCTNTGPTAGLQESPFCDFFTAFSKALTTSKHYLVVGPGAYSVNDDTYITSQTLAIIGSDPDPENTVISQAKNNRPVIQVKDASTVLLENLTLTGAHGSTSHGVYCVGSGTDVPALEVRRCILRTNVLRGIDASLCTVTVTRTKVQGNNGGGVALTNSDFVVENCLITGNGATGSGCTADNNVGGVHIMGSNGTAVADRFVNNTIADNNSCNTVSPGVQCEAGTTADIRNSIVWGNITGATDPQVGGTGCTLTTSWVAGLGGATDPYFKGGAPYDYHLQTSPPDAHTSPCIDLGTAAGAPPVDLDGKPRANLPDLGCYEAQ